MSRFGRKLFVKRTDVQILVSGDQHKSYGKILHLPKPPRWEELVEPCQREVAKFRETVGIVFGIDITLRAPKPETQRDAFASLAYLLVNDLSLGYREAAQILECRMHEVSCHYKHAKKGISSNSIFALGITEVRRIIDGEAESPRLTERQLIGKVLHQANSLPEAISALQVTDPDMSLTRLARRCIELELVDAYKQLQRKDEEEQERKRVLQILLTSETIGQVVRTLNTDFSTLVSTCRRLNTMEELKSLHT